MRPFAPQLRYWKSQLGDYRMNQITPEMIQLPKGKSPATCNRYLAALSAVFNNFGNVVNPVSRVKKYK
jgi:hypothetical protein